MGASAIPAVVSLIGLSQANKQQKEQTKAVKKAGKASERVSEMQFDVMDLLKSLATGYDPAAETQGAVDFAEKGASRTLDSALRGVKTSYGGRNPSGDTNFHISAQNATDNVLGPLAAWEAGQKASETGRKAALLQSVLGVPAGNLTDSYFKTAALTPGGNAAGSAVMLSQALQKMFGNQNPQNQSIASQSGSDASGGAAPGQVTDWSFLKNIRFGV